MVHPDHETRVGAHRIFSVVLVPSSVSPQKVSEETHLRKATDFSRALSRTVSVFSSSAALFGKLRDQRSSSMEKVTLGIEQKDNNSGMLNRIKSTYSGVYSMKASPAPIEESTNKPSNEMVGSVTILVDTAVTPGFLGMIHSTGLTSWDFVSATPLLLKLLMTLCSHDHILG